MEAKFKKGQSVRITKRNGEVIDGVIRDWDYNICTFGREYNVDYMKDGQVWTVICVPEDAIQELRRISGAVSSVGRTRQTPARERPWSVVRVRDCPLQ